MAWPTLHVAELAGLDLAQVIASAIGEQDLAGAAWAPQWIGDELRQVRDAAWDAHLTGLGPAAEADAARRRGDHRKATQEQERARGYRVLEDAYRQSEVVFAATMADRAEWESATRQQRQLAVAADAELRRRHPGQHFAPLRSAEPRPTVGTQRAELALTAGEETPEMSQWMRDLAAGRRTFAGPPPRSCPRPTRLRNRSSGPRRGRARRIIPSRLPRFPAASAGKSGP